MRRRRPDGRSAFGCQSHRLDVWRMTTLPESGMIEAGGRRLEFTFHGPQPAQAPTCILLHEGLGSAALWGDFRARLAARAGVGVFAYSREGYGASDSITLPRPLDYMQVHACHVLPHVIDAIGAREVWLVGHSDGASIAAVYAGAINDPRLDGAVLIAPHFFVEDFSLAEIRKAREAYETTDLRARLGRWHSDVDAAFRGWNDAWLDPRFANEFDIRASLRGVRAPLLTIQGADDQFGTLAQLDAIDHEALQCSHSRLVLPGVKHAPHREASDATIEAIAAFIERSTRAHQT